MSPRRVARLLVDAALAGCMLFLLSYPMARGLLRHGVTGSAFLALLVLHQALNLGWYRSLPRGRWTARRLLGTAADAALVAAALALAASSFAMAGDVFPFMPFPMPWWGRDLHMAATAWCFTLAAFHLGLHGAGVWAWLRGALGRAWPACAGVALLAGAWAFAASGLGAAMLCLREPPELPETLTAYILLLAGAGLFPCLLARLLAGALGSGRRSR